MNIQRIAALAADECVRQGVGLDRLIMLLRGYETAWLEDRMGVKPTFSMVCRLAGIVEPHNNGRLRTTPVTFADGGGSAHPGNVADSMFRLFANMPEVDTVDERVKQFLWIHPFVDGNGRMGWILYNWLKGTLDSPSPLPNFFGEDA